MTTTITPVQHLGRQLRYSPVQACETITTTARAEQASVPRTARALGISCRTLYRWLAEHALLGANWDTMRRDLSLGPRAEEKPNDPVGMGVPETVTQTATG